MAEKLGEEERDRLKTRLRCEVWWFGRLCNGMLERLAGCRCGKRHTGAESADLRVWVTDERLNREGRFKIQIFKSEF